jgi:hypothetical protein
MLSLVASPLFLAVLATCAAGAIIATAIAEYMSEERWRWLRWVVLMVWTAAAVYVVQTTR